VFCVSKNHAKNESLLASTQRYKYTSHTLTTSDLTLQDQSIYNEPYLVAIETRNVNCYPHSAGVTGNLQPPKITTKLQRNLHNNLKVNMTMGAVIASKRVTHKVRPSPASQIEMTSCHDYLLTSSAPNSGCI
jgi:hypothetical protein